MLLNKILLSAILIASSTFLLAKPPVSDEMEARGDGVVIRIAGTPCKNKKVLGQLEPIHHKNFRKAEVVVNGKKVGACWIVDVNGVFVIGEDGNQGYVPLEVFKPVETI